MAKIQMICPAPPGSLYGNRVTALRWARLLRKLGHRLAISQTYEGQQCDLLLALHARRSADAVFRFAQEHPDRPIIVALTGTDVYRDIHEDAKAQRVLGLATRMIALQPLARNELAPRLRKKVRVIYQSAEPTLSRRRIRRDSFDICVVGHLREVKDPFRAAYASRLLPSSS